jgi:hypothetical protein
MASMQCDNIIEWSDINVYVYLFRQGGSSFFGLTAYSPLSMLRSSGGSRERSAGTKQLFYSATGPVNLPQTTGIRLQRTAPVPAQYS